MIQRLFIVVLIIVGIVAGCYAIDRLLYYVGLYYHDHKHHAFGVDEYNPGFESLMKLEGSFRVFFVLIGSLVVFGVLMVVGKFILHGTDDF
jgi:hypothetical protein